MMIKCPSCSRSWLYSYNLSIRRRRYHYQLLQLT